MKNITNTLFLFLMALVFAPALLAQTATTRTALTSALTASATNVVVVSTTGMTAQTASVQTYIAICDGVTLARNSACEVMDVKTVVNSTTLTVIRARGGNAVAHSSGSIVWYGTTGNFSASTGNVSGVFLASEPRGACTRASNTGFLPVINTITGDVFDCIVSTTSTTDQWVSVNFGQRASSLPGKRLTWTVSTYTALLADTIIGVNTNAASTITLPACTGCEGKAYFVIDMAGGTTNAPATITIAGSSGQLVNSGSTAALVPSAVRNQGNWVFFDGSSNSWYIPRYGGPSAP